MKMTPDLNFRCEWKTENEVTLQELASILAVDRSNLRKYVVKCGFQTFFVKEATTGNQPLLAVTVHDAEEIKQRWEYRRLGMPSNRYSREVEGYFYIIAVSPDRPNRLKLGFSTNINARLETFQVLALTAELVDCWLCRRSWEQVAIISVTRKGCVQVGNEVFDCEDRQAIIQACDDFFNIMPRPGQEEMPKIDPTKTEEDA